MSVGGDSVAYQAYLIAVAAGGISWPMSVGRLRDHPAVTDNTIAFYDTPGQPPEVKYLVDYPTFMVMVRGNKDDYNAAYSMAKQLKDIFLGMDPFNHISGDRWDGVTMLGDINFLQYDENSRPLFSSNYRVIVERAATDNTARIPL